MLDITAVQNGRRVRIIDDVHIFGVGTFRAGLEGTIEQADWQLIVRNGYAPICVIRLDTPVPGFGGNWNCLPVYLSDLECTPANFEFITGFGDLDNG